MNSTKTIQKFSRTPENIQGQQDVYQGHNKFWQQIQGQFLTLKDVWQPYLYRIFKLLKRAPFCIDTPLLEGNGSNSQRWMQHYITARESINPDNKLSNGPSNLQWSGIFRFFILNWQICFSWPI